MRRLALLPLLISAAGFSAFGSVDPGLMALLPPDMKLVAGVDLEHARSSEFGQYMAGKISTPDPEFQQFVRESGFDPRHDLDQILFAATGSKSNGADSHFAILARGTFDPARIESAPRTEGLTSQTFLGTRLFVESSKEKGSPTAFAFLGDGIAVMGDVETVKTIISSHGTPSVLDPAMQAQISKVGEQNDAWFVSLVPGWHWAHHFAREQTSASAPSQTSPQTQALESILEASGGLRFGPTVDVAFDAVTRSPQDATSIADVIRFFTSMVQLSRQKDPRAAIAASAFDNMTLSTSGDRMHFSISLPENVLEELVENAPSGMTAHPHRHAIEPQAQ